MREIEFLKNLIADAELELKYIEEYREGEEAAQKDNAIYAEFRKKRNPGGFRWKWRGGCNCEQ